jgi:lysine N6-hydroxylase
VTGDRADQPYELVGVGIGPFNLALAALADGAGVDVLFLDQRPEFSWHAGLLISGTTLQVPFLADLVTLVDPTSRWSFLAYLHAHHRLFPFYFAERFHVPRREYDHYCRWVAESLPHCRFGARVEALRWAAASDCFEVDYAVLPGGARRRVLARNVVLGIGAATVVPDAFANLVGKRVFHAASYMDNRPALAGARDITVIGSGQSGAEIFLDLLRGQSETGWRLRWLTRTPAFAPMEYSKLGLEHFTPDYVRYFRSLSEQTRDRLVPAQWQLYKGISADTIAEIYNLLYERSVGGGRVDATLLPNVEVTQALPTGAGYRLGCRQTQQERDFTVDTDAIVLATGYAARRPDFLAGIAGLVEWDQHGRYRVGADYRVALAASVSGALYVQNAELHTHGVGAPDLGLGAWRAATILNAVTGQQVHDLAQATAFTSFGVA